MPEEIKKEINCGDKCFVMIEGKITETHVRAINRLERFNAQSKQVETKVEYFVKGLEREASLNEIYSKPEDCAKGNTVKL